MLVQYADELTTLRSRLPQFPNSEALPALIEDKQRFLDEQLAPVTAKVEREQILEVARRLARLDPRNASTFEQISREDALIERVIAQAEARTPPRPLWR